MRALSELLPPARLLQMLTVLQATAADLGRSANPRTDAELCLIRLCDERLDGSVAGLTARLERLEQRMEYGAPPAAAPHPARLLFVLKHLRRRNPATPIFPRGIWTRPPCGKSLLRLPFAPHPGLRRSPYRRRQRRPKPHLPPPQAAMEGHFGNPCRRD